ncbi:uncharacterized protein JCM6883_001452 [Sporobolomyces salmoneus]|uniref:uncharacterized protein n=1 Tax=Sporobolomyces salmoneus TaxID=183962 RepID=UPI0031733D75
MVAPDRVILRLQFQSREIPDLLINVVQHFRMRNLLVVLAVRFGVEPDKCRTDLRLLHDGIRLTDEKAGELVDLDQLGTLDSPVSIFISVAIGTFVHPRMQHDWERHLRTGKQLPQYRDEISLILKPLPTDPYPPPVVTESSS